MKIVSAILILSVLSSAAFGARGKLNRTRPLAQPRQLVGQAKTKSPNGYVHQYHFRWTVEGTLAGPARIKQLGRVNVVRRYKPTKITRNGTKISATEVNQLVTVQPQPKRVETPGEQTLGAVMWIAEKLQGAREPVMWNHAIRGVVRGLDPYSHWNPAMPPGSAERGAIGTDLRKNGQPRVVRSRRGSPAYRAGIRRNDLIVAVNKRPVKTFDDAAALLGGPKGTAVTVKVLRGGKPKTFRITRGSVPPLPVRTRLSKDGIGCIRLAEFTATTGADFSKALDKLVARNGKKSLRGLVIDLRDNGGGDLEQAVAVLDQFVANKTVVTTKGRGGEQKYQTGSKTPHKKLPLAVLVNRNSASSSEIVAGALRDLGRATIIGERTFGKTTVQRNIAGLPDGSSLDLTVARYYLPGGKRPIHGVKPHISYKQAKANFLKQKNPPRFRDYLLSEGFSVMRGKAGAGD